MKIILFPYAKAMRNGQKHPKNYPYWTELIELLKRDGHELIQLGVNGETQLVDDFRKNLKFNEICDIVKNCDTFISVDSFGQHLAWSLGKRGIVLFGQSDPNIFGHDIHINLLKDRKYLREKQFWLWEQCEANDEAFVSPEIVFNTLTDYHSKYSTTGEIVNGK